MSFGGTQAMSPTTSNVYKIGGLATSNMGGPPGGTAGGLMPQASSASLNPHAPVDKQTLENVNFDHVIRLIEKLSLYRKMQNPAMNLHSVTRREVVELFMILCPDATRKTKQGIPLEINSDDLLILCSIPGTRLTADQIKQMAEDCDRDGNGIITVDELYNAITQGSLAFNIVLKEVRGDKGSLKNVEECNRNQLVKYLRYQFNKNDACFSLPFTFLFFTMFLMWMGSHLEIRKTYELHSAIENEISGEGGTSNAMGPFLERDVHDIPTFWDWFHKSFVAAAFRSNGTDHLVPDFPVPGRLASFNQIVGGVALTKEEVENAPCEQSPDVLSFYDSRGALQVPGGECQAPDNGDPELVTQFFLYQQRNSDIRKRIEQLMHSVWLDTKTTKMRIRILFYNAHYGMFTDCSLEFLWRRQGLYSIQYRLVSFLADPYYSWATYAFDFIYGLLLLKMMYSESKELIPAIKNGVDGFMDYWEFWNAVDWLSITFGIGLLALWWHITILILGPLRVQIEALPQIGDDGDSIDRYIHSTARREYLSEADILLHSGANSMQEIYAKLDAVHETSGNIAWLYELLRVFIGIYLLIIMLRFFKGFRANPRLEVVTRTIVDGSSDIAHFFVVFMTIFLAFCATAQTLFGSRLRAFSDLASALNTGFAILLGDFDFASLVGKDQPIHFVSGTLWFWIFQWSVTIIMFNILLAIVMNQFAKADAAQVGAETIIEQAFSTYRQMKQTKGHLDIWYLLCEFEDDDDPAHPDKNISARSLRRAFPRMSKHNAEYLIFSALEYDAKENERDEDVTLMMACRMITKTLAYSKRMATSMDQLLERLTMMGLHNPNAVAGGIGGVASMVGGGPSMTTSAKNSQLALLSSMGGPGTMNGAASMGGVMPSFMPAASSMGAANSGFFSSPSMPGPGNTLAADTGRIPTLLEYTDGVPTVGEGAPSNGPAGGGKATREEAMTFLRDRFNWLDRRFAEGYRDQERIDQKLNAIVRAMEKEAEASARTASKALVAGNHRGGGSKQQHQNENPLDWRRLRRLEDQISNIEDQNTRVLEVVEKLAFQIRQMQMPRRPG
ncbi:unnamed protein product [Amoebophrya sp. A25]|nr:unnamed protein product [Amoebophrya sp. A25]|eukprot:GSA25T00023622001.1